MTQFSVLAGSQWHVSAKHVFRTLAKQSRNSLLHFFTYSLSFLTVYLYTSTPAGTFSYDRSSWNNVLCRVCGLLFVSSVR